ncbi:MAG: allophanate hydrolase, partial [Acidiferrobacteraceae bacterium]|nr:allophanate hydrolase [Acidiferrobacteraceae bacterium]
MSASPRFLANGDTVMVVEFGDGIDLETSSRVTALATCINSLALKGINDLVPTFRSLAVHYDPRYLAF